MLVYGTLAEEALSIHPRALMVGQKRIEGFWLSEWVKGRNALKMLQLFRRVGRLMSQGILTSEIGATFSLEDIKPAVEQAAKPGRDGKVLLKIATS
jgi:NADPH:quinone reductase-like Zn-dependent oxidoreductase